MVNKTIDYAILIGLSTLFNTAVFLLKRTHSQNRSGDAAQYGAPYARLMVETDPLAR